MISANLLIYLLIGPATWVLMFIGMRMAYVRMSRLLTWKTKPFEHAPPVTILIPAKDEGPAIKRCIDSALAQDYPNFNIIAINDRSTDDTGAILDELATHYPRLRVIHIVPGTLPQGWLGKCHALHVGAARLDAPGPQWLLFVDSDVTLAPNALSTGISIATQREYDAVSILTTVECHSFLERLLLPPLAAAWSIMHTISWTNEDTRKTSAYANGQFFLIRRAAYEKVGGHASVKDQITEDVELMRLLKSNDCIVRLFMGAHLAATRMHSTMKQMFNGWGRIYSGTARRKPWRILTAIIFEITAIFSVYPALVYGILQAATHQRYAWLAASITHYVLLTLFLMIVYRWSGNRIRYALLAPLSAAIMLAIFIFSLNKCRTGRISWRGTEFLSKSV